jgi:hypothetical protein
MRVCSPVLRAAAVAAGIRFAVVTFGWITG